eukprot:COSAG05_NODE_712_length_7820_cov_2.834089_1_plen_197_part_00
MSVLCACVFAAVWILDYDHRWPPQVQSEGSGLSANARCKIHQSNRARTAWKLIYCGSAAGHGSGNLEHTPRNRRALLKKRPPGTTVDGRSRSPTMLVPHGANSHASSAEAGGEVPMVEPAGSGFNVKRPIRNEYLGTPLHSLLILVLLASRIWRALHEYVNFVHDPEKQYKSLSVAHRPGGHAMYSLLSLCFVYGR